MLIRSKCQDEFYHVLGGINNIIPRYKDMWPLYIELSN